jgi:hypothetical protein
MVADDARMATAVFALKEDHLFFMPAAPAPPKTEKYVTIL